MEYDLNALEPIIGPPGELHEVDGYVWWLCAGGRLMACTRKDINVQTSVHLRNLPYDADIPAVIAGMGERVKEALARKEAKVKPKTETKH